MGGFRLLVGFWLRFIQFFFCGQPFDYQFANAWPSAFTRAAMLVGSKESAMSNNRHIYICIYIQLYNIEIYICIYIYTYYLVPPNSLTIPTWRFNNLGWFIFGLRHRFESVLGNLWWWPCVRARPSLSVGLGRNRRIGEGPRVLDRRAGWDRGSRWVGGFTCLIFGKVYNKPWKLWCNQIGGGSVNVLWI